jgi:hypothetical protein
LALGKTCDFSHSDNFFLCPVHFALKFLFEHFDLDRAFAFTLLDAILILPHTIIFAIVHLWVFFRIWLIALIFHVFIIFLFHYHWIITENVSIVRRGVFYLAAQKLVEEIFLNGRGRQQKLWLSLEWGQVCQCVDVFLLNWRQKILQTCGLGLFSIGRLH